MNKTAIRIINITIVIFGAISFVFFGGCNLHFDWSSVVVSSTSGDYKLSVVSQGDVRYIYNGDAKQIPSTNYVKLDISQIDRLGDAIQVCWEVEGSYWKISNTYAIVLQDNLIGHQYTNLLDQYGAPSIEGYQGPNCGSFLIREKRSPLYGNIILEYQQTYRVFTKRNKIK